MFDFLKKSQRLAAEKSSAARYWNDRIVYYEETYSYILKPFLGSDELAERIIERMPSRFLKNTMLSSEEML